MKCSHALLMSLIKHGAQHTHSPSHPIKNTDKFAESPKTDACPTSAPDHAKWTLLEKEKNLKASSQSCWHSDACGCRVLTHRRLHLSVVCRCSREKL